jgi:hypothetical protein
MRQGLVAYERFDVQTDFVLIQNSTLAISMGSEMIVCGGNGDLRGNLFVEVSHMVGQRKMARGAFWSDMQIGIVDNRPSSYAISSMFLTISFA